MTKDVFIAVFPFRASVLFRGPPIPDSRLLLLYKRIGFWAIARKSRRSLAFSFAFTIFWLYDRIDPSFLFVRTYTTEIHDSNLR